MGTHHKMKFLFLTVALVHCAFAGDNNEEKGEAPLSLDPADTKCPRECGITLRDVQRTVDGKPGIKCNDTWHMYGLKEMTACPYCKKSKKEQGTVYFGDKGIPCPDSFHELGGLDDTNPDEELVLISCDDDVAKCPVTRKALGLCQLVHTIIKGD